MKNKKRIIVAISVIFFIVVIALLAVILTKGYDEENLSFTAKLAAFYTDIIENVEDEEVIITSGTSDGISFSPSADECDYIKSAEITVDATGIGENAIVTGYVWTKSADQPEGISASAQTGATIKVSTPENATGEYYLHVVAYDGTLTFYSCAGPYQLDNTPPTVGTLAMMNALTGESYTSGTWTNAEIFVDVLSGSDSESGHKSTECDWQVVRPDGTTTGEPFYGVDKTLTEDGVHYLIVTTEDNAGNKAQSEWYFVRIDTKDPTMTLSKESGDWSNSQEVTITVRDEQEGEWTNSDGSKLQMVSGLKSGIKLNYAWVSSEDTNEPELQTVELSYTEGTNEAVTFKTKLDSEGEYYLITELEGIWDCAGNRREFSQRSGPFKLDKTQPTGVLQLESEYTNTGKVKWTIAEESDDESGVNYDSYCEVILDSEGNYLAGGAWVQDSIAVDGTYKETGISISAEGNYILNIDFKDKAGNITSLRKEFCYDKTAPTIEVTPDAADWAKSHTVTVQIQDTLSGTYVAPLRYGWSESATVKPGYTDMSKQIVSGTTEIIEYPVELPETVGTGEYYLWISTPTGIYDMAGNPALENEDDPLIYGPYKIDVTAPVINIPIMKYENADGEDYTNGAWTNQNIYVKVPEATDLHSGHASTTYTIKKGTEIYLENILSTQETVLTEEGEYYIYITSVDNIGNSATLTHPHWWVRIDKTNPTAGTLTFTNEDGTTYAYSNTIASLNWTNQNVTVSVANGSDIYSGHNTTTYNITYPDGSSVVKTESVTLSDEGQYIISLTTEDNAGNTVRVHPYLVNIDKTLPIAGTLTFTNEDDTPYTPGEVSWTNQNVKITLTDGTDTGSGHASTVFTVDGGTVSSPIITEDGTHTVVVTTRDNAGNSASNTYVVKIDKTAPIISNVMISTTEETTGPVTITVQAHDGTGKGLANEAYSFDNGTTWQTENTKTYTENTNGIIIKVRDELGNVSTHTQTINITNIIEEKLEIKIKENKYVLTAEFITRIPAETSIDNFINNLDTNAEQITILNDQGQRVTTGIISTGMTLELKLREETMTFKLSVVGDINGDGKAKLTDLSRLRSAILGRMTVEGSYKEAADINGDGKIKLTDLSRMRLLILGKPRE